MKVPSFETIKGKGSKCARIITRRNFLVSECQFDFESHNLKQARYQMNGVII
jgi:hypothetical protein